MFTITNPLFTIGLGMIVILILVDIFQCPLVFWTTTEKTKLRGNAETNFKSFTSCPIINLSFTKGLFVWSNLVGILPFVEKNLVEKQLQTFIIFVLLFKKDNYQQH